MNGAGRRRKGLQFERDVANMLRDVMPGADIKRGLQSRGGGAEEADVVCPYFHVECKKGPMPNPRAALKQAKEDAQPGMVPLGVVGDDRKPPFVVMELEDFLGFIKEWWHSGGQ